MALLQRICEDQLGEEFPEHQLKILLTKLNKADDVGMIEDYILRMKATLKADQVRT